MKTLIFFSTIILIIVELMLYSIYSIKDQMSVFIYGNIYSGIIVLIVSIVHGIMYFKTKGSKK